MASTPKVNVLEQCRVAPPSAAAAEQLSLPLTFYDLMWLIFHPIQRLHFYEFPHPKTHFTDIIIPQLKQSLSLTLKHFLPLAGNLISPLDDSGLSELRYAQGDSVSLTFSESSDDFNYLVGDHPKNADRFYPLLPEIPPPSVISGAEVTPLLALQITVFPNFGICIGCTSLHVLGDASAVVNFTKSWASINKFNGDEQLLAIPNSLPLYERSVIQDPFELGKGILDDLRMLKSQGLLEAPVVKIPVDRVRATYIMTQSDIQKLKSFVMAKKHPTLSHVSTFTVTCAYVWTCLLKSVDAFGEKVDDDELGYLFSFVDCRARLDPPIPPNYFGNCIVPCIINSTHAKLVGSGGLITAAALIGEAIHKRVNDKDGILKGSWLSEAKEIFGKQRVVGIAGSPKYDAYDADFGWGKPEKYESVSIDANEAMSLNKSSKSEGGLEIGLSLTKNRMNAFAAIFTDGLRTL